MSDNEIDGSDGDFEIADWISLTRISEDCAKKLEKFLVKDLATLMLFREADVEALKLTLTDSLRFRDGIEKLHNVSGDIPHLLDTKGKIVIPPKPVVPSDDDAKLYSLKDVEKLLAGKTAVAAGKAVVKKDPETSALSGVAALVSLLSGSCADSSGTSGALSSLVALLSPATASGSAACEVRDLMRDLLNVDSSTTNSRGEKALLPINFLSCVRGTQDVDEVIHSGKGLNLVLQASNKRVSPEKLTVGQWVGANARILEKLISPGKLTPDQITDYLVYNRKIGDLLQIFLSGSVFMLDHNHRLELNENQDSRWCVIDTTLQSSHLKRKDVSVPEHVSSGRTANASSRRYNSRRGVCWAYNTSEGCPNAKDRCK
jgi:hypothetical protein